MVSPWATMTEPASERVNTAISQSCKRHVGRLLEAVHLVERGDLLLVGEDDIGAFPDQSLEIRPGGGRRKRRPTG